MRDAAFELLLPVLNAGDSTVLWLVDENISAAAIKRVNPRPGITAISNRFDLHHQLIESGFNASLADFELPETVARFDTVVYRISKEKALVHHIINRSAAWLQDGGCLYLGGFKNEGVKTYIKKAAQYLGEISNQQRGDQSAQLACIKIEGQLGAPLDDKAYIDLRLIESDEEKFYSKPGVFGWQKIDKGSEFLVEQLAKIGDGSDLEGQSVLDLGCGYGYLSLKAGVLWGSRITAVDNNIAAVTACRKNLQHVGLDAEVVCDDCGSSLAGNFDWVLCNPPFHQGFDMESALTSKFISASYRLLKPGGKALFVVNAFIPLERKAVDFYDKVDVIANNKSFKVLLLSR